MKKFLIAAAFALASLPASAQDMTAQQFVMMAAQSDMFEIESSQLALTKAENAEVKEFAQQMINDHTAQSKKLMTTAQAAGVDVPETMAASEKVTERLQTLQGAEGDEFTAQYIELQQAGHEEAVALFESYAENGENAELKSFAEQSLPILRQHLEHAQGLEGSATN